MPLRVLIFGTTWVDTQDRLRLLQHWSDLHSVINPACEFLLIDSASPTPLPDRRPQVFSFPDNIGHLSQGGRDGWGRAFCHGLQDAIDNGYDYVVHIEGDSLFRRPVMPILEHMADRGIKVASVPVGYGQAQRSTWVETGLMFFSVDYLRKSNFIAGYDWPNRTAKPQPEIVIRRMLGNDLVMLPLKAERSDKSEITVENVHEFDWITHCKPEVYDKFAASALG